MRGKELVEKRGKREGKEGWKEGGKSEATFI